MYGFGEFGRSVHISRKNKYPYHVYVAAMVKRPRRVVFEFCGLAETAREFPSVLMGSFEGWVTLRATLGCGEEAFRGGGHLLR